MRDDGDARWPAVTRPPLVRHLPTLPLIATALAVTVLAWPVPANRTHTLDHAWMIGLHQAASQQLGFGVDIVFTYGPLGFLAWPTPFVGPTSALAFGVTLAIYAAVSIVLLAAARRRMPLLPAAVVALALARGLLIVEPFEALQLILFAVCLDLLARGSVARSRAYAPVLGAVAGAILLGKLSTGVFGAAFGLLAVVSTAPRPGRGLAVFATSGTAVFLGLWLVVGQPLADLPAYVRGSLQIISGYSDAMQPSMSIRDVAFPAFVAVGAVLVLAAWWTSDDWSRKRRLALAAAVGLLVFSMWKFHPAAAITILALASFVALLGGGTTGRRLVVGCAVVVLAAMVVTPRPLVQYLDAPSSVERFVRQASTAGRWWSWSRSAESTSASLRQQLDVPPDLVAQLTGKTVHIDPWSADVATALPEMRWQPMPIFQTYSAYTPYLDDLNAASLRAPDRPQRILRESTGSASGSRRANDVGIRGRFYWQESPAAAVERLCRYRELGVSARWQVLGATGEACGPERAIGTVSAVWGESVEVPDPPSPEDMVVVRIRGVNSGLVPRARATLWRGATWYMRLDDVRYALVPDTASQPLALVVPAAAQGSEPFAFGPPVRRITVYPAGESGGGGTLVYSFSAMSVPRLSAPG